MSYWRFAAMIATSTVVMFVLMYLNTYLLSHVFWSETRAYMAVLMGATMAVIMLAYMLKMYSSKAVNAAIFAGAIAVFAGSLWLVRSQATVGDTSFMRAMIPHHSIAIMTSSRANLSDPRVRKLAGEIIYAQDKEIAEMRYLTSDISTNGDAPDNRPDTREDAPAQIVSLEQALSTAHIAVLDPGFMTEAEIAQAFPEGPACTFRYTQGSPPVLAASPQGDGATALVKLSGDLVRFDAAGAGPLPDGARLTGEGIEIRITGPGGSGGLDAAAQPRTADMTLKLEAGLSAGYRGYYDCTG